MTSHIYIFHSTDTAERDCLHMFAILKYVRTLTNLITLSWCATMFTFGLKLSALSFATCAFDFPICSLWKRNWRFKLLTSMVSRSICNNKHMTNDFIAVQFQSKYWTSVVHTISMFGKPVSTRFFNISQPIPPAPTTNILELAIASVNFSSKTPATRATILLLINKNTKVMN